MLFAVISCGGGGDNSTTPKKAVNTSPVAIAGSDQFVTGNSIVTLDGSSSSDIDGDSISYKWIQSDGTTVSLSNNEQQLVTFESPIVSEDVLLTFSLTVTDEHGSKSEDEIVITVEKYNSEPVAIAGQDIEVPETTVALLDATQSYDPEENDITFSWSQIEGPTVEILGIDLANASFVAPVVDVDTTIKISLTVTDSVGSFSTDEIVILVKNQNKLPKSNAGDNQDVYSNALVTLDGVGSEDRDGALIEFHWEQISGDIVAINNSDSLIATFVSPKVLEDSILEFQLTVTDADGAKDTDIVAVTVSNNLLVTFETGDLSEAPFSREGRQLWDITQNDNDSHSITSPEYGSGFGTSISILAVNSKGDIAFDFKTSTEKNSDYLNFYVDDVLVKRWSGIQEWQSYSYKLGNGTHKLEWEYKKDDIGSFGDDKVWVDNILIPTTNLEVPEGESNWVSTLPGKVKSNIAVDDDDIIYVFSEAVGQSALYAINPDGSIKWQYLLGSGGSVAESSGVSISKQGNLYINYGSSLYSFNKSGDLNWSYNIERRVETTPSISQNGTIYITTYLGSIVAISSEGERLWQYEAAQNFFSSATIGADGTIYAGSSRDGLFALNSNGTLKWHYDYSYSSNVAPSIADDGTLYLGLGVNLVALTKSGVEKWRFTTSDTIGGTAINKDGVVYFKDVHGWFYAVNPDGSLGWKKQINVLYTYGDSAPTIAEDGTIYVTNSDSIYWSNNYGTLVSLSPNGDINWEYKTLRNGDYSPAIDSTGNVYFGGEYWDNNLISIKANSPLSSEAQWPKYGGNKYNTGNKR